jgi:hypothetical protein
MSLAHFLCGKLTVSHNSSIATGEQAAVFFMLYVMYIIRR